MRDNLVGGGFGLEAAQKEYKDEDRYGAGVCETFMVCVCLSSLFGRVKGSGGIVMPARLVVVSKGKGLGDTDTTAWGLVQGINRSYHEILKMYKILSIV